MAGIKVYYPNSIKYACKKRYNCILRPLPPIGGGGAATVATPNIID